MPACDGAGASAGPPALQVRPIQMGEFLRKRTGNRLLQLNGPDIIRFAVFMRQLGVGISSGAEALAS
eukprot:12651111-Prorocentrum_lima.AAC.1